jgi:ribosomal protein L37AE/L43A
MTRCPHCDSTRVIRIDKDKHHGDEHAAAHAAMHGLPVLAGALWLAKKAMDAITDDYQCKSCGKTFS